MVAELFFFFAQLRFNCTIHLPDVLILDLFVLKHAEPAFLPQRANKFIFLIIIMCSRKVNSAVANIKAAARNKANEQPFDLFEMMRLKICCRTISYSVQMGWFCPVASSGTSELRL